MNEPSLEYGTNGQTMDSGIATASSSRPNIFEIALVNRFHQSLKPAFEYAFIEVLLPQFNELRWLADYKDEIYGLIGLRIESQYLLKTGASLAEHLSGLKRVPLSSSRDTPSRTPSSLERWLYKDASALGLPPKHFYLSLLGLVVVPYVKSKLDSFYEQASEAHAIQNSEEERTEEHDDRAPNGTDGDLHESGRRLEEYWLDNVKYWLRTLKRYLLLAFLKLHPYIHALYEGLPIFYWWRFAMGNSEFPDHWLHLAGCMFRHLTMVDVQAIHVTRSSSQVQNSGSDNFQSMSVTEKLAFIRQQSLKWIRRMLILIILGYKLIQWWYSSRERIRRDIASSAPVPPPPPFPRITEAARVTLPRNPGICPISKKSISVPAATPTGITYEEKEILAYVQQHKKCPVTGKSCKPEDIRRLYEPR